jgi:hypothetical protein
MAWSVVQRILTVARICSSEARIFFILNETHRR